MLISIYPPLPKYIVVTYHTGDGFPQIYRVRSESSYGWGLFCEWLNGSVRGYVSQYDSGYDTLEQAQEQRDQIEIFLVKSIRQGHPRKCVDFVNLLPAEEQ